MNLLPTKNQSGEQGFAMLQVMMALGILGIMVVVFSGLVTQTVKAQKLARVYSEKINLQAVFRGSLTCDTSCRDLKRDVPKQIGMWNIKPVCSSKKLVLNVAHPDLYNGKFARLYKAGQENAVCKPISLPSIAKNRNLREPRRRFCNSGEKVQYVDFINQSIGCR